MSSPLNAIMAYAKAKSRADVDEALRHCTEDVVVDTYAFQITGRGCEEVRKQFEGFFALFPDYSVEVDGMIEGRRHVAGWGRISATLKAPLGDLQPTGQSFRIPFSCIWDVRDGLIAREQFFFDLNELAEQLGHSTDAVADVLREVRKLYSSATEPVAG